MKANNTDIGAIIKNVVRNTTRVTLITGTILYAGCKKTPEPTYGTEHLTLNFAGKVLVSEIDRDNDGNPDWITKWNYANDGKTLLGWEITQINKESTKVTYHNANSDYDSTKTRNSQ